MTADPSNPSQGLTRKPLSGTAPETAASSDGTRHEALGALLAFSALHVQLRQRRARSGELPSDTWEVERFVLDDVLHLVAERALAITGADGVAIALAEGDAIICRGAAGAMVGGSGPFTAGVPGATFTGSCACPNTSGNEIRAIASTFM